MNALLKLLKKYKLTDPAASTDIGEVTNAALQTLYNTLIALGEQSGLDALKVSGIIEETDMRDIKAAIVRSQKKDIDAVSKPAVRITHPTCSRCVLTAPAATTIRTTIKKSRH